MRREMKPTQNETSTHHKRNSVYITFYCGQNEISFRGLSETNDPFSKANQTCLRRCRSFLSFDFISVSVYMLFYHPK